MSDATSRVASNGPFASKGKPKPIVENLADGQGDRRPSPDLALDQPEKWLRVELVINLQTLKVARPRRPIEPSARCLLLRG
jgi:hypothetical protein